MRFSMNKYITNPRFPFQVITSHKFNVFICMLFLTEEQAMTPRNLRAVMLFLLLRIKKCLSLLRCRFLSSNILFYLTYPPPLLVFENHIIHIVRKDKVVHTATIELKMAILLSRIIKPWIYPKYFDKEKTWKLKSSQKYWSKFFPSKRPGSSVGIVTMVQNGWSREGIQKKTVLRSILLLLIILLPLYRVFIII
jgi:hypothetical protein